MKGTAMTFEEIIAILTAGVAQAQAVEVAVTCGAPTIAGTPCKVTGTREACRYHGGRTDEELLAHAEEVQAKQEAFLEARRAHAAKAKAKGPRKVRRATPGGLTRKEANKAAAAWARDNGFSASGQEWADMRDALLTA
jgi:hypothetical protein